MHYIKTICKTTSATFDEAVQQYLDRGYEIISSNCGIVDPFGEGGNVVYQAILLKEKNISPYTRAESEEECENL